MTIDNKLLLIIHLIQMNIIVSNWSAPLTPPKTQVNPIVTNRVHIIMSPYQELFFSKSFS